MTAVAEKSAISKAKVLAVGNSLGIVLSKEVLAHLKAEKGDVLYATVTPSGIFLSPYDPEFAAQMDAGRKVMKKYRDVLRKLAQ